MRSKYGKFSPGWIIIVLSILTSPVAQASSGDSLRKEQREIGAEIQKKHDELRENRVRIAAIKSGSEDDAPEFKGACDLPCRSAQGSCTNLDFQASGVEPMVQTIIDGVKQPIVLRERSDYACLVIYDANPQLSGISPNCSRAVGKCGEVAKAAEIRRLEAANKELEADIRALNDDRRQLARDYADLNKACPQCAYLEAMKPTGGQIAAGIIGALAPVAVAGIGAWEYNKGLNAYSSNYAGYLDQSAITGVPPQAPQFYGMGGMGGFGMGGFGLGMGGYPGMGGAGFGLNLGLGLGMGMGNGFGLGYPGFGSMGCIGYNPYSPWGNGGFGLNVGLGLNNVWNSGMYNPYANYMNPYAMGPWNNGGWNVNGNVGLNVGPYGPMGPWSNGGWNTVNPWNNGGWNVNGNVGLNVGPYGPMGPWSNGGGYNSYYLQIQQQQMMQQQMQAQMQAQWQAQQQAQYQAYLQQEMQRQMAAAQAQQDLMIAQQQMQEAQMRYYQSLQGGGGMTWGGGLNVGFQVGASGSWGGGSPWNYGSSGNNCQTDWQGQRVCGYQGTF